MTPAEQLSKSLKDRPKWNSPSGRRVVWRCRLLEIRQSLHLTLRDIEGETGVSIAVLSRIEHGTDPQLTTASKISAFFGMPISDIWTARISPSAIRPTPQQER